MISMNALISEFDQVSTDQWNQKIIADLKTQDPQDELSTEDEDGIQHLPFYQKTSLQNKELTRQIQNVQRKSHSWKYIQQFPVDYPDLEKNIKKSLSSGVDEVVISNIEELDDLNRRLKTSPKDFHHLQLHLNRLANNSKPKMIFCDPIGEMLKTGKINFDEMKNLEQLFQKRLNQLKPDNFLLLDGSIYKNAGATIVQELVLLLRHSVEYMDQLTKSGFTAEAVARSFTFKVAYGNSFFTEIAKTRALRYLIKKIYQAYDTDAIVKVWGESSSYWLAHKDPYTNLLRSTSQCMSASIGGCDLISCLPFDAVQKASPFGYRMSKNISLILKHESFFNKVNDLGGGSYYIENLSCALVDSAWKLFLDSEEAGASFFQDIESGKIGDQLTQSHQKRMENFKKNQKSMVGVNKYETEEADTLTVETVKNKGISPRILSKSIAS